MFSNTEYFAQDVSQQVRRTFGRAGIFSIDNSEISRTQRQI